MSTSNSHNILAAGDLRAWLDSLPVDERESVDLDTPVGSIHGALARIGATVITLTSEASMEAHGHPDTADAVNCYRSIVDRMREQRTEIAQALQAMEADPFGAAVMAYYGPDAQ